MWDQGIAPVDRAEWANTTSSTMVEGAKDGNPDSWRSMVRLYAPLVLWWCRRGFPRWKCVPPLCGVSRQDAADLVQDVFLIVCRRIKTFSKDGKPAAFRRWLYSVTRYRVVKYWGHHPGFPVERDDLDQLPAPEEDSNSAAGGRVILLRGLLELIRPKFKPRNWDAFWKVALEERSVQEVALELGMTENAVHVAKLRVLYCLRKEATAHEVTP